MSQSLFSIAPEQGTVKASLGASVTPRIRPLPQRVSRRGAGFPSDRDWWWTAPRTLGESRPRDFPSLASTCSASRRSKRTRLPAWIPRFGSHGFSVRSQRPTARSAGRGAKWSYFAAESPAYSDTRARNYNRSASAGPMVISARCNSTEFDCLSRRCPLLAWLGSAGK